MFKAKNEAKKDNGSLSAILSVLSSLKNSDRLTKITVTTVNTTMARFCLADVLDRSKESCVW